MIVVDGPDGAGKTTLCTMLARDGLVKGILESPGRTRGKVSLHEQTIRYLHQYIDRNLVVDRYLFSEMVYGPIIRKYCAFTSKEYLGILTTLIHHKNPIIFCLPESPQKLNLRLDQMEGVRENIDAIFAKYVEYSDMVGRISGMVFRYDLTNPMSYERLKAFLHECEGFPIRATRG
jgi:hypothetical protein